LEVIQRSTEFLAKKDVDSPRLQTELLLAHLLHLPRMQLYLSFDRALTSVELDTFRELIKRRGQREPLQHIMGSTSFCGLELVVNRHVLIPRPETELLAESGWEFLNRLADRMNHKPSAAPITARTDAVRRGPASENEAETGGHLSALDFGTGSGCLAIALAVKCPGLHVDAIDLSGEALELAKQNATHHGIAERIRFLQGDGFTALPARTRFDLVISNPPYIPTQEIETLEPEVRRHDPRQALDGGLDGLNMFRRLAVEAHAFLKQTGKMALEFGDGQAQPLRDLFEKQNWVVESILPDYTQRPRILIARRAD
jgi:release factor glutamine methyltransferase